MRDTGLPCEVNARYCMPQGTDSQRWRRAVAFAEPPNSWIDRELEECTFVDERLGTRFRTLLEQLSDGAGESIPMACQDWANTKAASRFFSNKRVKEKDILAGPFQSTRERFAATKDLTLVLHDTTEFSFRRDDGRLASLAAVMLEPRAARATTRCAGY
jgi:hypothetical protein